jgi:hypothetical protein
MRVNTEEHSRTQIHLEVANVHWGDIGGLEAVKQELKEIRFTSLENRLRRELLSVKRFESVDVSPNRTSAISSRKQSITVSTESSAHVGRRLGRHQQLLRRGR